MAYGGNPWLYVGMVIGLVALCGGICAWKLDDVELYDRAKAQKERDGRNKGKKEPVKVKKNLRGDRGGKGKKGKRK